MDDDKLTSWAAKGAEDDPNSNQNQRDITVQAIISIALGIFAFLAFCVRTLYLSPP